MAAGAMTAHLDRVEAADAISMALPFEPVQKLLTAEKTALRTLGALSRLRSAWFSSSFGEARRSASGAKAAAFKRRILSREKSSLRGSADYHNQVAQKTWS